MLAMGLGRAAKKVHVIYAYSSRRNQVPRRRDVESERALVGGHRRGISSTLGIRRSFTGQIDPANRSIASGSGVVRRRRVENAYASHNWDVSAKPKKILVQTGAVVVSGPTRTFAPAPNGIAKQLNSSKPPPNREFPTIPPVGAPSGALKRVAGP